MNKERPVNLNLVTIRFPVTAIVSILHRLSGVLLFLFIPLFLLFLHFFLTSEASFQTVTTVMGYFWLRFLLWVVLSALVYHLIAGIRHLLVDMHIGDTLMGGRIGAWIVMLLGAAFVIAAGVGLLFNLYM